MHIQRVASSRVPLLGLAENPAINIEHKHIHFYIFLSVLAQSLQIQQITNVSVPLKALPDSGYSSYPVQVNSLKQVLPYSLALKGEQRASRESLQHKPREVTRTWHRHWHWNTCKFKLRDLDPPALLSMC